MTKTHTKIGARNPFIPSYSPVCQLADWLLLSSVVLSGLVGGLAAIARQIGAF
ncbi:hypothetical protein [Rhizobium sp. Root1203]|uniref:hypothetical protein n=1 Tax=Rhizobium sp. Root1203 TaxID=1736427 RepID=UPI000A9F30FA|nr:hypothetical protein [Rhizobium sp. Root1203]